MRHLSLIGVAAACIAIGLLSAGADAATSSPRHFALSGTVIAVVDGDTIDVKLKTGKRERVRVIGINAPERGTCYAAQATAQTRRLALRKTVRLAGDRTQARRDRFGRLLAYVAVANGQDVGRRLLEGGFARVLVVGRPFQRANSYRASQRRAEAAGAGLWSACQADPPPPPPPPTTSADLSVTATPSTSTANLAQDVTYTVTIANAGPTAAQQVGLLANLPGVTFVSIAASQGTCATAPVVGCVLGVLAANSSATATIVVRTAQLGAVSNSVVVNSTTSDPSTANNTATITLTVAGPPPPQPPPPAANCHPSYPDVCIPPAPPDLDCGQIPHRRFRVIYTVPDPDPHGFDGDRDGIGCES